MQEVVNELVFEIQIDVFLRSGIADPEGLTIRQAAEALGFAGVSAIAAGRSFRVTVHATSTDEAAELGTQLGGRLLSNPVLQDFVISRVRVVD
jgi:phosphoribosylformylglycinamidine synthase